MREKNRRHLDDLRRATAQTLAVLIPPGSSVAVLDAPNQRNVGDSLIWAGELAYFKRLDLKLAYVADLHSYNPLALRRALPADGIVLLHGGGNFGDIWPGHQIFREQVCVGLSDHRVVQLPQSIYFSSTERAAEANRTLRRHPDFHVLLRDSPSMNRAGQQLPDLDVTFCPDMALGWEAPSLTPATEPHILAIARADKESSSGLADVGPDWVPGASTRITDWHNTGDRLLRWEQARADAETSPWRTRVARRLPLPERRSFEARVRQALFSINEINIEGGVELYEGATVAVVDRLHAHILATLLGIENVLLDNNYGKLSSIFNDYTHKFSTGHYAQSLEEARQLAASLIGERAQ